MSTHQAITPKYIIQASFEVGGVVEKPDVIGALFGQTEGLFGHDLDLHELQKIGRIGRIEIQMESKRDKTKGSITIPSSLDKALTALIAAAVESIDRVGPCNASVVLKKIEDMREKRRELIVNRAKEILHKWTIETTPTIDQVASEVYKGLKTHDVVAYGKDKLSAGPDIDKMNELIIVEGRADVAILLKSGITNVIASEGTKIPQTLMNLSKKKKVTAFLDGDRGGDLILKALLQVAKVDYVAKAPRGKEVEDLGPKQILKILKERVPIDKIVKPKTKKKRKEDIVMVSRPIVTTVSELRGTLEAVLLDEKLTQIERIPVSELCIKLQEIKGTHTIVFDGVITQRLLDIAEDKGIKCIIGERISGVVKRPVAIQILTMDKLATDTNK